VPVETTLVIGAGLCGLTVAAGLAEAGVPVTVLDKSRGLGGRLATRRAGPWRFDHGAQYLRPKTDAFAAFLDRLGAADWTAVPGARVGCPGMSALVRPLAAGRAIRTGARVAGLSRAGGIWVAMGDDGAELARAARVVLALPAPQVAALLPGDPLTARTGAVVMAPCWTLMAAFADRPDLPETARDVGGPLGWIARDGRKPERTGETWVAQASAGWSRAHIDLPRDAAAAALLDLLRVRAGGRLPGVLHADAHRWLYAQAAAPLGQGCLADPARGLVIAGDWCLGPRAEDAFHSAQAALGALGH
jgi:predicted NAD/FAD-dependent oxidoreductase